MVVDGRGGRRENGRGKLQAAVILPLWEEMEEVVQQRLAGLTIDDLLKRAAAMGIKARPSEPLNFAI